MKQVEFIISRDEMFNEVGKITGYVASKAALDGSMYETLAVVGENEELLDTFFDEARAKIAEVCYIYISENEDDGEQFRLVLSLPDNWKENEDTARQFIESYIIHYCASKWFLNVGGEVGSLSAKNEEAEYTGFADNLRKIVNRRSRPEKPYFDYTDYSWENG